MPGANSDLQYLASQESTGILSFPSVTKAQVLHCSVHFWYPRYRLLTPKTRLISLSPSFVEYLRSDGIVLPPEDQSPPPDDTDDLFSSTTSFEDEDEAQDPSLVWQDIHQKIKSTIAELDGSVVPKLNWSAPKDATWISATNSMECRCPNDIYLLLKSSDFITHDLEQAFDDCEDDNDSSSSGSDATLSPPEESRETKVIENDNTPYYLVLRKTIPSISTSLEFRCFVQNRQLLCICQRDLIHYPFLSTLTPTLRSSIIEFYHDNLLNSFPDSNFVFDVYIPQPYKRVWLIDINPWASKTDPLLFSWRELLTMGHRNAEILVNNARVVERQAGTEVLDEDAVPVPEFRLVRHNDPEAFNFSTPQYSAHKLPKDVVDASADGGSGIRDLLGQWREILASQEQENS